MKSNKKVLDFFTWNSSKTSRIPSGRLKYCTTSMRLRLSWMALDDPKRPLFWLNSQTALDWHSESDTRLLATSYLKSKWKNVILTNYYQNESEVIPMLHCRKYYINGVLVGSFSWLQIVVKSKWNVTFRLIAVLDSSW